MSHNSDQTSMERLQNLLNVPATSRPPEWVNPLEKIEQLLTCSVCLDRYKNPKLLPCQHTFCLEPCLEGLADSLRRTIKCPECRAEHPLPLDGPKNFLTNYSLVGFLEIHFQATEDNAAEFESYIRRYNLERCKVCDEKAELTLCCHCEKKICRNCSATHFELLKRDLGRLIGHVRRVSNRVSDSIEILARNKENLKFSCNIAKDEIKDYG
uniref:RING-type domain-containing protein n=1 Tax=Romanomermis culicivorax TaxID=13658 RepID=A0A915J320_ROMCU